MYEIRQTASFEEWFLGLKTEALQLQIAARFKHMALGNLGDWKAVGEGVGELSCHFGPSYRVYFTCRGKRIILLRASDDESTQASDIAIAIRLARMETDDGRETHDDAV